MQQNIRNPNQALGEIFPGFDNINRFIDRHTGYETAKILPGEYFVSNRDMAIGTVLGSCISACIRDKVYQIGGMNHFMLPKHKESGSAIEGSNLLSEAARYGSYAMEHLINDILKHGGHRKNLEVKIFGGARVIAGLSDIGEANIRFARKYLLIEDLEICAEDVGGSTPRKLIYYPASGRVQVKRLQTLHNDTVLQRERTYQHQLESSSVEGEIELFG